MNQLIEESTFENETNMSQVDHGKIAFLTRLGYVKEYPDPVSVLRPLKVMQLSGNKSTPIWI